ncbi:Nuclear control of ATPase protein 2 [Myotisia sp. PD_48]|nr:Nuclear control of ATPase protein 2 [Myotisia sp. PD_48]
MKLFSLAKPAFYFALLMQVCTAAEFVTWGSENNPMRAMGSGAHYKVVVDLSANACLKYGCGDIIFNMEEVGEGWVGLVSGAKLYAESNGALKIIYENKYNTLPETRLNGTWVNFYNNLMLVSTTGDDDYLYYVAAHKEKDPIWGEVYTYARRGERPSICKQSGMRCKDLWFTDSRKGFYFNSFWIKVALLHGIVGMSLIGNHVHRLDAYLDRLQLEALDQDAEPHEPLSLNANQLYSASTIRTLVSASKAFSMSSSSSPVLKPAQIVKVLRQAYTVYDEIKIVREERLQKSGGYEVENEDEYEDAEEEEHRSVQDLVWVVASKATLQTFAAVISSMLDETVLLSDGVWYWDEVLGSSLYTTLYAIQTAPVRWGQQLNKLYRRARQSSSIDTEPMGLSTSALSSRWKQFYHIIHESIQERSMAHANRIMFSSLQLFRTQARSKRRGLKKLLEMNACAVGLLMQEGLLFDAGEDETRIKGSLAEWNDIITRTALLMQNVLMNINQLDISVSDFEDIVFKWSEQGIESMTVQLASDHETNSTEHAYKIMQRLIGILDYHLKTQREQLASLECQYRRPSRLVRYWPAGFAFLLSSSTILNMLTNRKEEMVTWVREFGSTVVDFWSNWIVQPLSRLVGTIRHDERSEVALVSKNSLEADLSSLERMVVDFVQQRPQQLPPGMEAPDAIKLIREGVREGDLTPVLRAYERDLQRPFIGALRGDLVTALLIQVQKTKVDVEIAISGINSLLKSQELVFAFIGLTPSILISYSVVQYFAGVFGNRKGLRQGQKRRQIIRSLRAVNRILIASPAGEILSYKDHGLLICEVEVLRHKAYEALPGPVYHDFREDLNDLLDVQAGVAQQLRVVDQIRWTYAKWLYS